MKWQENFSVQQVLNINWFQFPLWYETYNSSNFKNYWHIFFQRNYRLTCWNCFAAAPLVDSMPINKLPLSMDNIGNETILSPTLLRLWILVCKIIWKPCASQQEKNSKCVIVQSFIASNRLHLSHKLRVWQINFAIFYAFKIGYCTNMSFYVLDWNWEKISIPPKIRFFV